MAGHAKLADGWTRALSVLLTGFSLLLSSYLLLWLYDGEGVAPVPITIGEAATSIRDLLVEEPVELLFWGLAMITAFDIAGREGPGVEEGEEPASNASADDVSLPIAQVVRVTPHPSRAADLKLGPGRRR